MTLKSTRKKKSPKLYKIVWYKKHYLYGKIMATSLEEATSLAWSGCPKDSWVDKIEELT
jgi:hypothetical protein